MGLLAKQATKKLVTDVPATKGGWASDESAAALGLNEQQLVTFAIHAALLGTPSSRATSTWISGNGKYNTAEIAARTTSSLLRSEGGLKLGSRVALGSPDPATRFIPDWIVDIRHNDVRPVIDVSSYRTQEDQVPNKQVLTELRSRVLAMLSSGPTLRQSPGPPDFGPVVEPNVLTGSSSLFRHDYTLPPPPALAGPSWSLNLPPGSADLLSNCIDQLRLPLLPPAGAERRVIDLSGGRASTPTKLALISDEKGDRLAAELVDPAKGGIGPGGHHRDVRAILRTLQAVVGQAADGDPASVEPIKDFLAECESYSAAPDRVDRFVELWNKDSPAPAIRVRSGMTLPVGVTFRTTADGLFDALIDAERWLLVRQRTWSKGYRRASRDKSRIYTARRPVVLKSDKLISYLRYAQVESPSLSRFSTSTGDSTWFWELDLNSRKEDGVRTGSLLVSGLSVADGYLAYGPELATAMRAFCWLLQGKDPKAAITTLLLTVP